MVDELLDYLQGAMRKFTTHRLMLELRWNLELIGGEPVRWTRSPTT
jgi:hypothetical protein